MTSRRIKLRRAAAVLTCAVALGAGILSYFALYRLGERTLEVPHSLLWLFPLTIDVAMITGAIFTLVDELDHRPWSGRAPGWIVTLVGVTFSTWVQMMMATTPTGLSRLVHASPPVVVAIMWWLLMRVVRREIVAGHKRGAGAPTSGTATRATTARVAVDDDQTAVTRSGDSAQVSARAQYRTPYGGPESEVAGSSIAVDVRDLAHSARSADPMDWPAPAREAGGKARGAGRERSQPALDRARREVADATARGERLTGGELARRMGVHASRGRQLMAALRAEIKQEAVDVDAT